MTDHDDETDEERTARIPAQLTRADISRMFKERRYDEIAQARKDGRCALLMNSAPPLDPGKVITQADVKKLYAEKRYDEITQLRQEGRLNNLLDPTKEN